MRALHAAQPFELAERGTVIASGRSIGKKIGAGPARLVLDLDEMAKVQPGDVLVTDMTDPDWEPIMKRASAIVTNRGGRTCHAAIIARELGIPAVVGTHDATASVPDGARVTRSVLIIASRVNIFLSSNVAQSSLLQAHAGTIAIFTYIAAAPNVSPTSPMPFCSICRGIKYCLAISSFSSSV